MKMYILSGGLTQEQTTIRMSADRVSKTAAEIGYSPVIVPVGHQRQATLTELVSKYREGDVVLPLISGVEGFLTAMDIPYIGSDPTAAGIAANKGLFNDLVRSWGLGKVPYVRLHERQTLDLRSLQDVRYPVFVKPARLGGSNGISKVERPADLDAAISLARGHDTEVLIEGFAGTVEIEIAAICGEKSVFSEPGLVSIPEGADWHSSAAKQTSTMSVEVLRDSALASRCVQVAQMICTKLGVSSGVRIDLFHNEGALLVGEINCVPGHNPASNFPKVFELSGVSRVEQLTQLVQTAFWKRDSGKDNRSRF